MLDIAQVAFKSAAEIARTAQVQQAPNGIRYGSFGDIQLSATDLEQIVQAVPQTIAAALHRKRYYFVPLVMADSSQLEVPADSDKANPDAILIAPEFSTDLSDGAICHRNAIVPDAECVFISTRLMQDRFALAFEFYINTGHHFVDAAGVPESFMNLVWSQAEAGVRGETSQDAWEHRARALGQAAMDQPGDTWGTPKTRSPRKRSLQRASAPLVIHQKQAIDEKARTEYFDAAFADAIAIYLLSLTVDFEYAELREREYPLLMAPALAERLRHVTQLFPPNAGQEFSIRYRRRNS
jgi:hypothetical protein